MVVLEILVGFAPFEAWPTLLNICTNQLPSGESFCLFVYAFFGQNPYLLPRTKIMSWLMARQYGEPLYQIQFAWVMISLYSLDPTDMFKPNQPKKLSHLN